MIRMPGEISLRPSACLCLNMFENVGSELGSEWIQSLINPMQSEITNES